MAEPIKYDVFVSYSRRDIKFADRLSNDLSDQGIGVFVDREAVQLGVNWSGQIAQAIDNSKAFIVALSPDSIASQYVKSELELALSARKPIFPVSHRATEIPSEFRYQLAGLRIFNLEGENYSKGLGELQEVLKQEILREPQTKSGVVREAEIRYPVKSGDTLSLIAQKYHTTIDAIMSLNPQITNRNNISPGMVLTIPFSTQVSGSAAKKVTAPRSSRSDEVNSTMRITAPSGVVVYAGPGLGFSEAGMLQQGDGITVSQQAQADGLLWGRIGPDQWIVISGDVAAPVSESKEVDPQSDQINAQSVQSDAAGATTSPLIINSESPILVSLKYSPVVKAIERRVLPFMPSPSEAQTLNIVTPWGETTTANSGDFLVSELDSPDAFWPVDPQTFEGTYTITRPGYATLNTPFDLVPLSELTGGDPDQEVTIQNFAGSQTVRAGGYQLARNSAGRLWLISNIEAARYLEGAGETVQEVDTVGSAAQVSEAERAKRLQAAIEANLFNNNRSQAVFNDKAQGEDQLGIKDEVEALAETLLLRDVEPPVAVGVMGGWGSGKSFAMYLISKYAEQTRAKKVKQGWPAPDQAKNPDIPAYVGHIYQIHFNAWTYAKSNLWASLMDTIFSCLNRQMQLERLFAYQELAETEGVPAAEQVRSYMMNGGENFKKIYLEDYEIDQDPDLTPEQRKRREFWTNKLLNHNLLWQVMRNQNKKALEEIRADEEKLEEYKSRRATLEQSREAESISISKLDDDPLAKSTYLTLLQSTLLTFVSDALSETTRESLKKNAIKEPNVLALKTETERLLKGTRGLFDAVHKNKYYWLTALSIAAITVAFPYVWDKLGKPAINEAITGAIALVTTIVPLIPTLLTRWQKIVDFDAETKKAFEKAYEAQQTRAAKEIASSDNQTFAEKEKRLEDEIKKGSLPACDVLIQLKESQIELKRLKVGPAAKYSNLLEFVQSRLDAATYETQLGLMHQVRQDIDELTYSLVDRADKNVFPRGKPRVILYIDDLDRCPPSRVVEILEAVQLLLNTKLFVIILGLDTRYVTRALEKEYKEILQHEGDPSGLDYIEKIIQIPYRVRPIERESLQKYLETQMDIESLPEPISVLSTPQIQDQPIQNISPAPQAQAGQSNQPDAVEQTPIQTDAAKNEQSETASVDTAQQVEEIKLPEIELPAAIIQFKRTDLEDLTICCQKIALTPRSIKRLVNVFKLMKIFWFRADKNAGLEERDRSRPVKQAAMSLLALSSAYPEVMREAFVYVDALYRLGQEQIELFTALNAVKLPPGTIPEIAWQLQRYRSDLVTLASIKGESQTTFGRIKLQDFKYSNFNLIRSFSFVGDPVYWSDGAEEEEKSKLNGQGSSNHVTKLKSKRSQK